MFMDSEWVKLSPDRFNSYGRNKHVMFHCSGSVELNANPALNKFHI